MLDRFEIDFEIIIDYYKPEDIQTMQWAGAIEYKSVFENTFIRSQKGEVSMLVARGNGFPVARLWIDHTIKAESGIGIFYALNVIWILRSKGIGSKLINTGEALLVKLGLRIAEISVNKNNPRALALYKKLGYLVIRDEISTWEYDDLEGINKKVAEDVWVLQKTL